MGQCQKFMGHNSCVFHFHFISTKYSLRAALCLQTVSVCLCNLAACDHVKAEKTKWHKSSSGSRCSLTLTAFPRMNFFIVENRPVSFFCILPRPLTEDGSTSQCFRLAGVGWLRRPKFGCWGALRTLSLIMLHRHIEKSEEEKENQEKCWLNIGDNLRHSIHHNIFRVVSTFLVCVKLSNTSI